MARYAATTEVPSDRSRGEIERVLRRYGATSFAYAWDESAAVVGFVINGWQVRFELPLPSPTDREFTHTPGRGVRRSDSARDAAYEQAVRQRWRALALIIKAKLEAVKAGIVTLEEEFLAHLVLPGGQTVAGVMVPQLASIYASGELPALGAR